MGTGPESFGGERLPVAGLVNFPRSTAATPRLGDRGCAGPNTPNLRPPAGSGPPQTRPAGSPAFWDEGRWQCYDPGPGRRSPITFSVSPQHPASSGCPTPETVALHGAHHPCTPSGLFRLKTTTHQRIPILPSTFRPPCRPGAPR